MSTMSQFFGGGGGVGLGQSITFPGQQTPLVTIGTQQYLATGAYVAAANADPSIASMPHMKVQQTTALGNAGSSGARSLASNNAGTLVIAPGSGGSGNVYYSTDGGSTWIFAALPSPATTCFLVTWTGTHFIAFSADASGNGVYTSRSTDGVTWVTGPDITTVATNYQTGVVGTDGSGNLLFYAVTIPRYSTDHGVSWASVSSFPSGKMGSIPFRVGNNWVVLGNVSTGSAVGYTSVDVSTGIGTSRLTVPWLATQAHPVASNNSSLMLVYYQGWWTTTDGINWTNTSTALNSNIFALKWLGSKFVGVSSPSIATGGTTSAVFTTTTDGVTFTQSWLVPAEASPNRATANGTLVVTDSNYTYFVFRFAVTATGFLRRFQETTGPASLVGSTVSSLSATGGQTDYLRIK
jgi:hypothetical protein